ncbi:MAG TPA: SLC13 family permease [Steroidobacteraceae bacterium]|nr:SLC13 family permease [Steroidobacteraceae bacterium]
MSAAATGWIHTLPILGLILIFVVGTLRSINLGVLSLAGTYLVGTLLTHESLADMYRGFPVDLLILLVGVTYLFGIAASNGTIERIVAAAAGRVRDRHALIPWMLFVLAAVPTMAGALGSAAAAMLAPIALRLAERCSLDRRMVALMVLHGSACGNFSPLNALGVIVLQGAAHSGLQVSASAVFLANVAYNLLLATVIFLWFRGWKAGNRDPPAQQTAVESSRRSPHAAGVTHAVTTVALVLVGLLALAFGWNVGFVALLAAVALHVLFPQSSRGAERRIPWDVVLLVCGIVTYVSALQRAGTVDAIGSGIVALGTPLLSALLICAVAAVTSAFASSAGILGVMMLLAAPFMAQGAVNVTGLVIALAISATVVDSSPFSTAGALVVANAAEAERAVVYRGLLAWAALMAITAPLATWLLFIVVA